MLVEILGNCCGKRVQDYLHLLADDGFCHGVFCKLLSGQPQHQANCPLSQEERREVQVKI